ncbi:cytochrome P450 [Actinomadura roseirufa]|uniref:cytochrome P450 n=1 Tax=Actinomadura roseirufa TaxID=2094049 RepID=UPI001F5EAAAC|nr:cytochrome P450 [Actinomadura roseirufa]
MRTAVGHSAWLVTGYEEVRALLDDDRLGRSHPDPANASRSGNSVLFGGPRGQMDRERRAHARTRSMFLPYFTAKRMRMLRPRIDELTDGLLDGIEDHGAPADIQKMLATPLPILVICELLGVPYEDQADFRAWTEAATNTRDRDLSVRGSAKAYEYVRGLVARKRREPGDDVISRLCGHPDASDEEIVKLGMKLLVAGHETTVSQIGWGVLFLLSHPRQWQMLLDDPSRIDDAAEEILRAPVTLPNGVGRYAQVDLEIDDAQIKAGDLLLLENGAGNHDPNVFPEPDRFDITRRPNRHLTFGHGAHYCVGAPLARMELQSVLARLMPRFPELRLAAPVTELRVRDDGLTSGLVELPVSW